jgi:excisionase family DNA binding protein
VTLIRPSREASHAASAMEPLLGGGGRPRLALSPSEAAEAIGVSRDFFDEHVRPELRIVRRGRRVLVPVRELERWLDREASRVLDDVG